MYAVQHFIKQCALRLKHRKSTNLFDWWTPVRRPSEGGFPTVLKNHHTHATSLSDRATRGSRDWWFLTRITREQYVFFAVVAIITLVPLLGLNQVLTNDEVAWVLSAVDGESFPEKVSHPPLATWFQIIAYQLFGDTPITWRITPFLFGTATLLLALVLGWRARWLVLALLGLNPLHVLGALQVDIDGGVLVFFALATLACAWKATETKRLHWWVLAGTCFGFALLSKLPALMLLPPVLLYVLWKTRSLSTTLKNGSIFAGIGILFLGMWPLFAWLTGHWSQFVESVYHTIWAFTREMSISDFFGSVMIQILLATVWIGPLGFCLAYLRKKQFSGFLLLNIFWVAITLFFYIVINQDPGRPLERYLHAVVPSLALIGASVWGRVSKKGVMATVAFLSVFSLLLSVLLPRTIIPFYPKIAFLKEVLSGNLLVELPITGSSGPVGFGVVAAALLLLWGAALVALLIGLWTKKHSLMIGTTIAYGVLLLSAFVGGIGPDVSDVSRQVIDEITTNTYPEPLVVFRNFAFLHYTAGHYSHVSFLDYEHESNAQKVEAITAKGGTYVIIDFPAINKESPLWRTLQHCDTHKTFASHGRIIGHIFVCKPNRSLRKP